jgi:nicotinate-nucleotide adenylyltransferase
MTRRKPARLGLFGGTFDPIHLGHLRAAEEAAEALELERVCFLPCAVPPHKRDAERIAPAELRLEWLRLAVAGNPRFEVDPVELDRPGPSYSVDTLRAHEPRPGAEPPVFLIGQDAFAELDTWREPEALLELASFAVLTRPPRACASLAAVLPPRLKGALELAADGLSARHRAAPTWVRLVPISALDISSTGIRAHLRAGRSIRYLVPETVREAILASGAYADREAG